MLKIFDTSLFKRISLAVLNQALPEEDALEGVIDNLRKSFLAIVITGVLFASFLIVACFSLFLYLQSEGLSSHVAILISSLFLLSLSFISGLISSKYLNKLSEKRNKIKSFNSEKLTSELEDIFNSFLDGLEKK